MIAMSKFVLKSRDYDFETNPVKVNFRLLQSYMVWFRVEIAFILGPHGDNHCNHIWSPLLSRLQSYLVLIITRIAVIFGRFHKNYWNHKWYKMLKTFIAWFVKIIISSSRLLFIANWYDFNLIFNWDVPHNDAKIENKSARINRFTFSFGEKFLESRKSRV